MNDPDNPALDALFPRAATHPELRVELCRALLEAELYTRVPRGESTRPAEMIARPRPGKPLPFIQWRQEGKNCYFVSTSPRLARKGLRFYSRTGKFRNFEPRQGRQKRERPPAWCRPCRGSRIVAFLTGGSRHRLIYFGPSALSFKDSHRVE